MAGEPDTEIGGFEAAFDRLAELGSEATSSEMPEVPEDLTQPVEAVANETPEEPVEDTSPEEPADDDDSTSEDVETPDEEVAPAAAASNDDQLLERFAKIVQQKAETPVQDQYVQEPPPAREIYSPEERDLVSSYEKDWPDVARAEDLRWRSRAHEITQYIFSEVAKEITPLLNSVNTLSERTHLNDLYNKVEDYDDVRDRVIDWVGKQPAYLQPAYQHVIQRGTVDEVSDLISRWRQATEEQPRAATPAKRRSETELPTATKQAAAALAPVSSKRSAIIQGVDPNDFESAFSEFAGKL